MKMTFILSWGLVLAMACLQSCKKREDLPDSPIPTVGEHKVLSIIDSSYSQNGALWIESENYTYQDGKIVSIQGQKYDGRSNAIVATEASLLYSNGHLVQYNYNDKSYNSPVTKELKYDGNGNILQINTSTSLNPSPYYHDYPMLDTAWYTYSGTSLLSSVKISEESLLGHGVRRTVLTKELSKNPYVYHYSIGGYQSPSISIEATQTTFYGSEGLVSKIALHEIYTSPTYDEVNCRDSTGYYCMVQHHDSTITLYAYSDLPNVIAPVTLAPEEYNPSRLIASYSVTKNGVPVKSYQVEILRKNYFGMPTQLKYTYLAGGEERSYGAEKLAFQIKRIRYESD